METPNGRQEAGFTLIELSIVLVIIGLIVGGVLVGQDLIDAASTRATIGQIEKYNTAVHTFRTKYNCIPGDCAVGGQFGFTARGTSAGQGDGNGLLDSPSGYEAIFCGEMPVFWVDLSQANLIGNSFTAGAALMTACNTSVARKDVDKYLPLSKLGRNIYIYAFSGGPSYNVSDGKNYWGLSAILGSSSGSPIPNTLVKVSEAYNIDIKVDDGYPMSGRVMPFFTNPDVTAANWATGTTNPDSGQTTAGIATGGYFPIVPNDGTLAPGSATTCYDNDNDTTHRTHYSMQFNKGINPNCTLAFQFQ